MNLDIAQIKFTFNGGPISNRINLKYVVLKSLFDADMTTAIATQNMGTRMKGMAGSLMCVCVHDLDALGVRARMSVHINPSHPDDNDNADAQHSLVILSQ